MTFTAQHSPQNGAPKATCLTLAKEVLNIEANEINALSTRLDQVFVKVVETILACNGRVVVSGMGKSGHIAGKIASTFASTGTPAFFMHPAEANHGDLGMITKDDILVALSNSGESDELMAIVPTLKRLGTKIVAITGNSESRLAKTADWHLSAAVSQEACPLGLAPTSSSTVALALGDALALCVLDQRDFTAEDFARSHPGGSLGRKLLTTVEDLMHQGEAVPKVLTNAMLSEGLLEMSAKGLGLTAVVNEQDILQGIFTDGDLRRALQDTVDITNTPIHTVMSVAPQTIAANELAAKAVSLMETKKINALLVTDEQKKLIGAINMHDLLQAKVV